MPRAQRKGRPTAPYALHRLKVKPDGLRPTPEELSLLGVVQRRDTSPAARRELWRVVAPILEERRAEAQHFVEMADWPPEAALHLVSAFEVTCNHCGKPFLPQSRKRRKRLRALCDGCRDLAKVLADRERLRRNRATGVG